MSLAGLKHWHIDMSNRRADSPQGKSRNGLVQAYYNWRCPEGFRLVGPRRCADEPLNRLCQMKASLRRSSMSFSVQSRVGSDWRNIIISWKSILMSLSDHLTRKAAQT